MPTKHVVEVIAASDISDIVSELACQCCWDKERVHSELFPLCNVDYYLPLINGRLGCGYQGIKVHLTDEGRYVNTCNRGFD